MNAFDGESVFLVGDERRSGMPRRWIDGKDFARPYRGVRAPLVTDALVHPAAQQRIMIVRAATQFAVHMHPGAYFSHTTAAVLWDLPLPMLPDAQPHVSVIGRAPRMVGIHGHQIERPAWGSLRELEAAAGAGRRHGADALRQSLPRIRPGVASRMETWVRLIIVDGGLPEPRTDYDVFDESGRFVGCVDLAYAQLRVAIEYEGDQHRTDPRQWQRDIEKHERLADLGWRVVRISRNHVFGDPAAMIRRVRGAIGRER